MAIIATFKGNCWRTMNKYLARTNAIIVVGQEIKVRGDDNLAEASQWAQANG